MEKHPFYPFLLPLALSILSRRCPRHGREFRARRSPVATPCASWVCLWPRSPARLGAALRRAAAGLGPQQPASDRRSRVGPQPPRRSTGRPHPQGQVASAPKSARGGLAASVGSHGGPPSRGMRAGLCAHGGDQGASTLQLCVGPRSRQLWGMSRLWWRVRQQGAGGSRPQWHVGL